ncbi:MAG: RNA 2',3'-cyclic phosphodiesterase [Leptospiraceae bacterium]|nr:RNA 2',3'-cyclic phosphodiesterase [Leptospiraceae bacterium]
MSLFIAISLPESIREKIFTIMQDKEIPEELWEKKEDLHITLLFLQKGNPESEYIQSIKDRLKKLSFYPFRIKIEGVEYWTLKENRQILHLSVKPSKELIAIQSEIVSLIPEVPKSTHEFKPHISLVRSSRITQSKLEELKNKFSSFSTDAFLVNQIHLYIGDRGKADEDNKRNRYRVVGSFPN